MAQSVKLIRAPEIDTLRRRAMGTTAIVQTSGARDLACVALDRIGLLEARWSRFIPTSDISRLNAQRVHPVVVHADTRRLVRHGIEAWQRTAGACDPTVLEAVVAAGYDRSFDKLDELDPVGGAGQTTAAPAPGCSGIRVVDALGSVTLPAEAGFDPGAIGKGLAADLVVDELRSAGAHGAFVCIGGDIRVDGTTPGGDGWLVEIREPSVRAGVIARVSMSGGGLATSTTRRRRWTAAGQERHHIIDPRTGRCAESSPVLVTAIAGDAWWAEALATHLMLSRPERWQEVVGDDGALIIDEAGSSHVLGRMGEHLR